MIIGKLLYSILFTVVFCLLITAYVESVTLSEFRPKEVKDLNKLEDFNTIEEFENYVNDYVQGCLDTGGGGTAAIQCLVAVKLWDRELNIIYKKLYKSLDEIGMRKLKKSQKAWLLNRDLSVEFTADLLYKEYPIAGTMYYLLSAAAADRLIAPIVKNRVMTLRKWFESVNERTN